ncbi:MAG: hypothetical protein R3F34_12340 [Planctomycetota bacterium]
MTETTSESGAPLELRKVEADLAQEVLEKYEQGEEALAVHGDGMSPGEYLAALLEAEEAQEALAFLAFALPRRDALAWCLRAVREHGGEPSLEEAAAVESTAAWIEEPSDECRRAAGEAAERAGYESPAGCLALSVFFAEGSMSPADCPAVPVGESYCPKTVSVALQLLVLADPDRGEEIARELVQLGVEAANTPAPWDSEPSSAAN